VRPAEPLTTVLSLLLGIGVAIVATRVIFAPVLQTVAAGVLGWLLGTLIGAAFWLGRSLTDAGVAAATWDVRRVLLGVVIVAIAAAVFHGARGVLDLTQQGLGSWRHLVVGVAAAFGGLNGVPTEGTMGSHSSEAP
jgi:hypothetical protein